MVIGTIESENQIENDATKIARGTRQARYNSVIWRKDVRNKGEVGAVTSLGKDSDNSDSPDQSFNLDPGDSTDANHDQSLRSGA